MFLKPKLHKEFKNGLKTMSCFNYPVMIFSKNCFRQKNIEKIGHLGDFLIFMANIRPEDTSSVICEGSLCTYTNCFECQNKNKKQNVN